MPDNCNEIAEIAISLLPKITCSIWMTVFKTSLWNSLNSSSPSSTYMRQWTGAALVQVMACRLFGTKPLPEPMLTYCQLDPWEQNSLKFELKYETVHSQKCIWNCHLHNGGHFAQGRWVKVHAPVEFILIFQCVQIIDYIDCVPGASPTKHISIEFEIRRKFRLL